MLYHLIIIFLICTFCNASDLTINKKNELAHYSQIASFEIDVYDMYYFIDQYDLFICVAYRNNIFVYNIFGENLSTFNLTAGNEIDSMKVAYKVPRSYRVTFKNDNNIYEYNFLGHLINMMTITNTTISKRSSSQILINRYTNDFYVVFGYDAVNLYEIYSINSKNDIINKLIMKLDDFGFIDVCFNIGTESGNLLVAASQYFTVFNSELKLLMNISTSTRLAPFSEVIELGNMYIYNKFKSLWTFISDGSVLNNCTYNYFSSNMVAYPNTNKQLIIFMNDVNKTTYVILMDLQCNIQESLVVSNETLINYNVLLSNYNVLISDKGYFLIANKGRHIVVWKTNNL